MFAHILSIMTFLPVCTGLLLLVLPVKDMAARTVGLAVSSIVFICGLKVYTDFGGTGDLEFVEHYQWVQALGISYYLGVDGISLFVLLTAALLFPFVFLLFTTRARVYYANLLIALGAMIGAICSADIVVFYVFWEVMLLPIFFLIGLFGGERRVAATIKITIYTIAGSLCMLAALVFIATSYHLHTGVWSFEIGRMATLDLHGWQSVVAFFCIMFAFAIKIPLFPFHTWLPDAYTEAPTAATFVLSAVMAKIGVYGVIRFVLPVFDAEFARYAVFFACLGGIGLIYCGLAAIAQKDMKRLLAFSSASHMGIIAVGLFCLNVQALTGTLFQIIAHATSTGILFLFVALLEQRTKSRQIETLGGVAYKAPILATFFAIAMLASCGLPGTSGFIGEFLIILGAIHYNLVIGVLAATTLIIGVCYMLWMFQRVFFEKSSVHTASIRDLNVYETIVFLPVILLILVMGIYPQPFLARISPAAERQIELMQTSEKKQYVAAGFQDVHASSLTNENNRLRRKATL